MKILLLLLTALVAEAQYIPPSGGGGGASGWTLTGSNIDSGSNSVTVGNIFVVQPTALTTPTAPVITHSGTPGSSTWGYVVVARNLVGGSTGSAEGTTTTGNATLTGSNFNIVTTAAVSGSTSCDVYRKTADVSPATTGLIGNVTCGSALNDTGLATITPFSSPQSVNTSIGVGTNKPIVSSSSGSSFGCLAQANNDQTFPFFDSGTGLSVVTNTACASFDYNAFLIDIIVDSNKTPTATAFDIELFHTIDNAGGGAMTYFTENLTDHGAGFDITGTLYMTYLSASARDVGSFYGFALINPTFRNVTTAFYGMNLPAPTISGTAGDMYQVWLGDLSGVSASNAYAFWYDSPGVYRIKADGVAAYYNPAFTKYTPGASNFERVVQQWNSNVAEIGTEAGGTGTLRDLRLIGAHIQVNAGGGANAAVCYKSDGVTLGKCTSVVGAGGTCTCS